MRAPYRFVLIAAALTFGCSESDQPPKGGAAIGNLPKAKTVDHKIDVKAGKRGPTAPGGNKMLKESGEHKADIKFAGEHKADIKFGDYKDDIKFSKTNKADVKIEGGARPGIPGTTK